MSPAVTPAARSALAQLTEGVSLPLPALPPLLLTALADGVAAAWHRIPGDQAGSADEPALNTMLIAQLNRVVVEDGRLRMLVAAVGRGVESISFDGASLEMRPDLSIFLTSGVRVRDFPLAIECKIIDRLAGKDVGRYCQQGLRRFVDGAYGWARREALMVAYVRDWSGVGEVLGGCLFRRRAERSDPYATESFSTVPGSLADQACSLHGRAFGYPARPSHERPGSIAIRHLWLGASAGSGVR